MAARDVIVISVILFSIAALFFVIKFASDTAIDRIVSLPAINTSQATVDAFQGTKTNLNARLDYLFFGLFIGFILAVIITGWFVGANPIFMFIYFIITIVGVTIGTVLSNVWQQITTSSVFGTTISGFPITNHVLSYFPLYIAVITFIGIVVMYAKQYITGEL